MMLLAVLATLASCSSDYTDVIPSGSQALMSIDIQSLSNSSKINKQAGNEFLKNILHVESPSDVGLDFSSKIYLFESTDGSLGLVAKVSDEDDLADFFGRLQNDKVCTPVEEKHDCSFTVINDAWLVGFTSSAMLVMGPTVASARAELMLTMSKYLGGSEKGITEKPIFDKLTSLKTSVALVSTVSALPAKFAPLAALGAPEDADPSSVMIAAEIENKGKYVQITGEPFSFDKDVNDALKSAQKTYRPITGEFSDVYGQSFMTMYTNVDGSKYLQLLRSDKGMRAMLAGLNTLIDADKMIKSINGDVIIRYNPGADGKEKSADYYQLKAHLCGNDFMKDVGYWQKSLPAGASLRLIPGTTAYRLHGDEMGLDFSATPTRLIMTSDISQPETGKARLKPTIDAKGHRFIIYINPDASKSPTVSAIMSVLSPVLGNIGGIVYTVK